MSLINIINNSFNKFPNKEIKENLTEKELDALILENTNKLISIKTKYDEVKNNWKALREDIESLSMYDRINCGENIKEQFQKAIDDLKLDYIDTKTTLDTYKAQKNKLLLEDNKSEDPIIDESEEIIEHLQDIIDTSDIYEVFKYLYNKLVPKSGPANTVAGEIIRALMAIMNGVLRNNQVFYDGEGKDKFGSAFYYLTSKGYTDILEDAIGLTGDDYISIIEKTIDKIARDFIYNPELLKTQNMEDYTQFTPIIQEKNEDCGAKKKFKEAFHPSYEELQNGDEIIVGGQHLYVADAEYDDDYIWVTDEKEDRYNKRAPGNTLNKCLIDEVIGQPDEEELDESLKESSNKDDKLKDKYNINENKKELTNMRFLKESNFSLTKDDEKVFLSKNGSMNESLDFTNAAEIKQQLDKYSGQYLTITFKGSQDWKHISELLDEYNDGDEEEADLALDKLESIYGSEYKLLKALEVDEISEITAMDRGVVVTIKVDKDNLYHNYANLINNPSVNKNTVKILELDKPTVQSINTSSMTRDEMVDFIADYVWDLSDAEYEKFKDKVALNLGIVWDNLKEDPEEGVYPSFTDNGLRIIIDKIIKAKPVTESYNRFKGPDYKKYKSLKEDNIEGKFSNMAGQIGLHTCEELEDFLEREGYAGALETLKSIMLDYLTYELDDLDFVASESKSIKDESLNSSSLYKMYLDRLNKFKDDEDQLKLDLEDINKYNSKIMSPEEVEDLKNSFNFYINKLNGQNESLKESIEDPSKKKWAFIKSKEVEDSDGFLTDYTWYEGSDGTQAMVFGDNDIYKPEDGYFDITFTDRKQAEDWFNSY